MIILNINKFHHIQGGSDRHYLDLTKLLESHGHKVIPFAMQSKKNKPSSYQKYFVSEVNLSQVKFSFQALKKIGRILYSLDARKKIKNLIKKEKPEIAHIHNIYHQISPSILGALKKNQIPIIMTVHDYKLICPNYKLFNKGRICEKCKFQKYYQCFLNKCVKDSYSASLLSSLEMHLHKTLRFYEKYIDIFICPSQFVKNKLIAWRMPEKKLIVLPHFIKPEKIAAQNKEKDYVLYFGRLAPEKGLDLLLSTVRELPKIKFKIAGRGPEKERLLKLLSQKNISNVKILGFKNKKELKKLIADSCFVVVPSMGEETFGLAVLEAFNLGKTVVASARGALPELVSPGKCGLLFKNRGELREKIQYLFYNPKIAQAMGQKAKVEAEKYDPESYYRKLTKNYQKLLII